MPSAALLFSNKPCRFRMVGFGQYGNGCYRTTLKTLQPCRQTKQHGSKTGSASFWTRMKRNMVTGCQTIAQYSYLPAQPRKTYTSLYRKAWLSLHLQPVRQFPWVLFTKRGMKKNQTSSVHAGTGFRNARRAAISRLCKLSTRLGRYQVRKRVRSHVHMTFPTQALMVFWASRTRASNTCLTEQVRYIKKLLSVHPKILYLAKVTKVLILS